MCAGDTPNSITSSELAQAHAEFAQALQRADTRDSNVEAASSLAPQRSPLKHCMGSTSVSAAAAADSAENAPSPASPAMQANNAPAAFLSDAVLAAADGAPESAAAEPQLGAEAAEAQVARPHSSASVCTTADCSLPHRATAIHSSASVDAAADPSPNVDASVLTQVAAAAAAEQPQAPPETTQSMAQHAAAAMPQAHNHAGAGRTPTSPQSGMVTRHAAQRTLGKCAKASPLSGGACKDDAQNTMRKRKRANSAASDGLDALRKLGGVSACAAAAAAGPAQDSERSPCMQTLQRHEPMTTRRRAQPSTAAQGAGSYADLAAGRGPDASKQRRASAPDACVQAGTEPAAKRARKSLPGASRNGRCDFVCGLLLCLTHLINDGNPSLRCA